MNTLFVELLLEYGGDLDLLFSYLTELLGSSAAAEQSIVSEDVVI